jgi:hypothetical protein
MSLVVAGVGAGLMAASPERPAQPVGEVTGGTGEQRGEQWLDLVARQDPMTGSAVNSMSGAVDSSNRIRPGPVQASPLAFRSQLQLLGGLVNLAQERIGVHLDRCTLH